VPLPWDEEDQTLAKERSELEKRDLERAKEIGVLGGGIRRLVDDLEDPIVGDGTGKGSMAENEQDGRASNLKTEVTGVLQEGMHVWTRMN
jgi:hypothetical protein